MDKIEPVAWMNRHDEPMLFPTRKECASYCDWAEDEQPIALYAESAVSALLSENARLRAFLKEFADTYYEGDDFSPKYFADKARALSAQEDA